MAPGEGSAIDREGQEVDVNPLHGDSILTRVVGQEGLRNGTGIGTGTGAGTGQGQGYVCGRGEGHARGLGSGAREP